MEFYQVTSESDFSTYYKLKCQEDAILWSGFKSKPNEQVLYNHFENRILKSDNIIIYYLKDNDSIIGYAQATIINDEEVEFSATNIFGEFQGQGYLQDMTILFLKEMKRKGFKRILGWASERNKPAEFNLKFNKFVKTEEFEIRSMPLLGGEHKFYKWVKEL